MLHANKSLTTNPLREGLLVGFLVWISGFLCIWSGYNWMHHKIIDDVRDRLEQLALVAAPTIDGDLHQSLTNQSQINSAEHRKALAPLIRFHKSVPTLTYVYTCISQSNKIFFVLDTATSSNQLNPARKYVPSAIMEVYNSPEKAMWLALETGVATSSEAPSVDRFGTTMSGYAPIYNSAGKQVGIVGVDLSLEDYNAAVGVVWKLAIKLLGILTFLAVVTGGSVWWLRRRVLLTEQRSRQIELAKAEQQKVLRALLDNAPIGIWLTDMSGKMLFANRVFCQTFGSSEIQFLEATNYTNLLPPTARESFATSDQTAIKQEHPHVSLEQFKLADGQMHRLEIIKATMHNVSGQPAGIIGLFLDVTERDRIQSALRESEQRYRVLLEVSPDTVLINRNRRISYINPAGLQLFGAEQPEQILGRETIELFHAQCRASIQLEPAQATQDNGDTIEGRIVRLDGGLVDVEISVVPLTDLGSRAAQIILRDITYRKKLENTLRQSQKMEAVGTLAGGIAHDFNNLLAVIQGNSDMISMEPGLTKDGMDALREISSAANRAAMLVQQLLAFSRKTVIQRQPVNLNDIISNLVKMLRRLIREDIELECHYENQPLNLYADPVMLDQIIINLAVNARDAMPYGGRLTIRAKRIQISAEYQQKRPESRPGGFARLSVSDTGCGISTENLSRIFEPFFTTKEIGKGTGLGLATVHGIVQQHEGWIEVDSEIGTGTTLHVFLPLVTVAETIVSHDSRLEEQPGGGETILLVEDETSLLTLISRVLRHHGYHVLEARSGVAALEIWKQHSSDIQLLFSDIVMPQGMSGVALAHQLQSEKTNLKILLTSGYSQELMHDHANICQDWHILEKPCAPWKILEAVRKCLDGK